MPPAGAAPSGHLILASFSLPAGASPRVMGDALQRPLLQSGGEMTTTGITYTYDALYRLTNATYSTGDVFTYTYDAVGNRLTQTTITNTTVYTYDIANRLINTGGMAYTWDSNGNLLNDGASTCAYDSANRLKMLTQGANTNTFGYNGLGDRLQQTINGNTTTYVLDLNAGLTQVLADGTNTYLYGNGRIAQYAGTTPAYFLGDALGSARQLANASGAVTLARSYEPFGSTLSSAGSGTTVFQFTGEMRDPTGLTFLRSRYLDTGVGRFLSRDVWEGDANRPMSYNAWLYAYANPIKYADPTGRSAIDFFQLYGITFTAAEGTAWSSEDQLAIRRAVWLVARRFSSALGRGSGGRAGGNLFPALFRKVYGINKDRLMTFEWDPLCYMCRPDQCQADENIAGLNGTGVEIYEDRFLTGPDGKPDYKHYWQIPLPANTTLTSADCACRPKGGYTHDPRSIEFASLWPDAYEEPGRQQLRQVNNVIHELGHAFNDRLVGKIPENTVQTAINNKELPARKPRGFYEAGTEDGLKLDWIQSSSNEATEVFADQFIGWVYGKWSNDAFGRQRRDFMDKHMRNWIEQAMKGGE